MQDHPLPGVVRNHFLNDGVPEIYYFSGQYESDLVLFVKAGTQDVRSLKRSEERRLKNIVIVPV